MITQTGCVNYASHVLPVRSKQVYETRATIFRYQAPHGLGLGSGRGQGEGYGKVGRAG